MQTATVSRRRCRSRRYRAHAASAVAALLALQLLPPAAFAAAQTVGAPDVYAITNAKIVTGSGKTLAKGTVVVRDGLIVAVGEGVKVPGDAKVFDGTGLTVYPGLIDGYSTAGMPAPADYPADRNDAYPVKTVRADVSTVSMYKPELSTVDARRKMGFGASLVAPYVGVFSGTSAVVSLGTAPDPSGLLLKTPVAMHLNFDAPEMGFGYPSALMGKIAVARQAMYDAADAERRADDFGKDPRGKKRPVTSRSLTALRPVADGNLPLVLHADDGQAILRALKFAREFHVKHPIIEGATEAYKVVPELKAADAIVLLSANLPEPPRVTPGDDDPSTLQGLRRRALAPRAAALLAQAGVPFALTTDGVTLTSFNRNVRRMIAAGLTEDQALDALTMEPARVFGVDRQIGSLEVGKVANLVAIAGTSLFAPQAKIRYVFVDGKQIDTDTPAVAAPVTGGAGGFGRRRPGGGGPLAPAVIAALPPGTTPPGGTPVNPASVPADAVPAGAPISLPPGITPEMALKYLQESPNDAKPFLPPGVTVEQAIAGLKAQMAPAAAPPAGGGRRGGTGGATPDEPPVTAPPPVGDGPVPPLPPAIASSFVLRGATVWTVGAQGTLPNADVYVKDGKVAAVGVGLKVPGGTTEIDARGKHITPGMIDCHSHTAIDGGVNEGSNIVTAECRIQDVIDAEDVNIYRQLAGGTTAANVLHGSANAIGGQNAVVKWRWGKKPDELLLAGAPQGIKFALGENPKQSNFTRRDGPGRYPATRMGVEKVIRDSFGSARDYAAKWKAFEAGKTTLPPRRDLQLDALAEVLDGKRLVHCHSYRQDEILSVIRIADDYGFRIGTFQHVLEGYKIADELAKHGAGASTFSDWWAFKIEAWDAIPYNGALMTERGVVSSFNSDSSELARRLNLEAAKAIRWGNMTPGEAIKLVTINPAKQLGIDKMVGSLEAGKDADLVVWSGDPLSTRTVAEKTFVDGMLYFDRQADLAARPVLDAEKKRLASAEKPATPGGGRRVAAAPSPSAPTPGPSPADGRGETLNTALSSTGRPQSQTPLSRVAGEGPGVGAITAIVGGTVHPITGPAIPGGVVLMQGRRLVAVGPAASVAVPAGAKTVDATGLQVYPGLIDADTQIGLSEIESIRATQDFREMGDFSPELRTVIAVNPDSELIPVARQNGILSVATAPDGGTISGVGALINLQGWTCEDMALNPSLAMYVTLPQLGQRRFRETAHRCEETSGSPADEIAADPLFRSGAYVPAGSRDTQALRLGEAPPAADAAPAAAATPGASPDTAALRPLNEFFADARRYGAARKAESGGDGVPVHDRDSRLEAMLPVLGGKTPVFVRADRARDIRAAVAWAKREGVHLTIVGGQEAVECADVLAREKVPVILGPVLNLPREQDLPYDDAYSLPARLARAGVTYCLSTGDTADVRRLPYQAGMAAAFGLAPDEALKAITLYPARILGMGDRLGSLEAGKEANVILTTGDPLEIESVVKAAFIAGQPVDLSTKQTRLYDKYRARPKNTAANR